MTNYKKILDSLFLILDNLFLMTSGDFIQSLE